MRCIRSLLLQLVSWKFFLFFDFVFCTSLSFPWEISIPHGLFVLRCNLKGKDGTCVVSGYHVLCCLVSTYKVQGYQIIRVPSERWMDGECHDSSSELKSKIVVVAVVLVYFSVCSFPLVSHMDVMKLKPPFEGFCFDVSRRVFETS